MDNDDFDTPEAEEAKQSRSRRAIGLIIAVIAGVLAVVSYLSNENDLDQILTHVAASNQTALYHAGKERCDQLKLELDKYNLQLDKFSAADEVRVNKLQDRYQQEIANLEKETDQVKVQADKLEEQATHLSGKDTALDISKVGLQLAVVLCSITVMTEHRFFTYIGIVLSALGAVIALWTVVVMS